jgi:two-component sensor histidine kinase
VARLHALGEAHDILTTENWDKAPLRDVVERALRPFATSRIVISGQSVALPASSSLMLTLCLHELATNAAKYGALSNDSGKVQVAWETFGNDRDRKVRLTWRETSGPPVTLPERKGFGSLLIEQAVSAGSGTLDFRPDGLTCALELSLL